MTKCISCQPLTWVLHRSGVRAPNKRDCCTASRCSWPLLILSVLLYSNLVSKILQQRLQSETQQPLSES